MASQNAINLGLFDSIRSARSSSWGPGTGSSICRGVKNRKSNQPRFCHILDGDARSIGLPKPRGSTMQFVRDAPLARWRTAPEKCAFFPPGSRDVSLAIEDREFFFSVARLRAFPKEARPIIRLFHPCGACPATSRGLADRRRRPIKKPPDPAGGLSCRFQGKCWFV